jgi:hypothetical protein
MAPTTLIIAGPQNDDIVGILEQKQPNPPPGTKIIVILHGHAYSAFSKTIDCFAEDTRITVIKDFLRRNLHSIVSDLIFGEMERADGVSMQRELSKYHI